jgi:hypothetical protein
LERTEKYERKGPEEGRGEREKDTSEMDSSSRREQDEHSGRIGGGIGGGGDGGKGGEGRSEGVQRSRSAEEEEHEHEHDDERGGRRAVRSEQVQRRTSEAPEREGGGVSTPDHEHQSTQSRPAAAAAAAAGGGGGGGGGGGTDVADHEHQSTESRPAAAASAAAGGGGTDVDWAAFAFPSHSGRRIPAPSPSLLKDMDEDWEALMAMFAVKGLHSPQELQVVQQVPA